MKMERFQGACGANPGSLGTKYMTAKLLSDVSHWPNRVPNIRAYIIKIVSRTE